MLSARRGAAGAMAAPSSACCLCLVLWLVSWGGGFTKVVHDEDPSKNYPIPTTI